MRPPTRDEWLEVERLRRELAKAAAERDGWRRAGEILEQDKDRDLAALRARVEELEKEKQNCTNSCVNAGLVYPNVREYFQQLEQRNAELVAALRDAGKFAREVEHLSAECQDIDEESCVAIACECEDVLARAESVTPAKHLDTEIVDWLEANPDSLPYYENGLWRIPYLMDGSGGFGGGVGEFNAPTVRRAVSLARTHGDPA